MHFRVFVVVSVTAIMLIAAAMTTAHHREGHDGGPQSDDGATPSEVTLEPGGDIRVYCEGELHATEHDDHYHLACEEAAVELPDDGVTDDDATDDHADDGEPEPDPTPTPTPIPDPDPEPTSDPALIDSYLIRHAGSQSRFTYMPRQFEAGVTQDSQWGDRVVTDAGPYEGWDVFITDAFHHTRTLQADDWIRLHLNRDARIAIVWQADQPVPSWMDAYEHVGPLVSIQDSVADTPRDVYEIHAAAGHIDLGGVIGDEGESNRSPYLVLIAEADGTPSPEPAVPAGFEVPVANQECPGWVHDQYMTTGPDGNQYHTWHNIIDPVYWCYFGHEHGASPDNLGVDGFEVAFDYTAAVMGSSEGHVGFKGYAFHEDGVDWYINHHFGTSSLGRACRPMHTMEVAAAINGELVADIKFMGNHNESVSNQGTPLTPDACADQYEENRSPHGQRRLPVYSEGETSYEPWRVNSTGIQDATGLRLGSATMNTINPITICADTNCNEHEEIETSNKGDLREIQIGPLELATPDHADANGYFYTNVMATEVVEPGSLGSIRQYVAPGLNISASDIGNKCRAYEGWGRAMQCDVGNDPGPYIWDDRLDREDSLRRPN